MAREGEVEAVEDVAQHPLAEGAVSQIGGQDDDPPVPVDPHLQRVAEIRLVEQRVDDREMVRHPAIVVAEIGDDPALRLLQRPMPVQLPLSGRLLEVEKSDALVPGAQVGGELARLRGSAVSDDEQFEVPQGLLLHALHREAE